MNTEFYRNFVRIVECGTLSGAARSLHIAQSALSSQVRQLEREYGTPLLLRGARSMEPTQAGQALYEKARSILLLLEEAHREVEACGEGTRGTVRVGLTQACPDSGMTGFLLRFHQENPEIRFEFHEATTSDLLELLRDGRIEVGIVRSSGLLPPLFTEGPVIRERLCAYCLYGNPWISPCCREVDLSALDQVPVALSRAFAGQMEDLSVRAGIRPGILSVSTSRSIVMMWAEAGAAVGIVCAGEREAADNARTFYRPLTAEDPVLAGMLNASRSFLTVRGRELSGAAGKFLAAARRFFLPDGPA